MALPLSLEVFGFPITLAFARDGRVFFSERITGNLWEVKDEKSRLVKHFHIVPITGHHETGLLGIALDPDFDKNDYLYCFYTYGSSHEDFKNKVVRIKSNGEGEETLLEKIPAGWIHNGGIMAFGPDKTLFIGVGVNNEEKEKSQDINFLGEKFSELILMEQSLRITHFPTPLFIRMATGMFSDWLFIRGPANSIFLMSDQMIMMR